MKIVFCLLALLVSSTALGQTFEDMVTQADLNSIEAKRAVVRAENKIEVLRKAYKSRLEELQAEFEKATQKELNELAKDLDKPKDTAKANDNLDEAVRIRDFQLALTSLKVQQPTKRLTTAPAKVKIQSFTGSWFANTDSKIKLSISPKGIVKYGPGEDVPLVEKEGRFVFAIRYNLRNADISYHELRLTGEELLMLNWPTNVTPGSALPKNRPFLLKRVGG